MAPLAKNQSQLKSLAATLALGGLILALTGLAYFFLSPRIYQATTRLRVVDWVKAKDLQNPTDENVVFVECDLIRSNQVVDRVIQNLRLGELWGKHYNQGKPLSLEEARAHLLANSSVRPVPHSSIIDVRVFSEEPDETAKIANAIANTYLDFRLARHQEQIHAKLDILKKQWDAQNEKIRDAQAVVDKLFFAIAQSRSTNKTQFYDSDAYDLLLNKRAQLQADYDSRQNQLEMLKKMDREKQKDVLTSLDTNSLLSATLLRLSKAQSELFKARLDHSDDSQQVKDATLVVETVSNQVGSQIDAAMTVRETDLEGLKKMVAEMDKKIKNASTNTAQVTIQDEGYNKALRNLKQLKLERDELQKTMDDEESQDAIKPTGVRADIIEVAETPAAPATPDPKVAGCAVIGGGIVSLAGLLFWIVSQRPKPAVRR